MAGKKEFRFSDDVYSVVEDFLARIVRNSTKTIRDDDYTYSEKLTFTERELVLLNKAMDEMEDYEDA